MVDVVILVEEVFYEKELEYIARIFSSILQAQIKVQNVEYPIAVGAITIGYVEDKGQSSIPEYCKIIIVPDLNFWKKCIEGNTVEVIKLKNDALPILYSSRKEISSFCDESTLVTNCDIVVSSFWLLSRYEECSGVADLDQHERYKYANSQLRGGGLDKSLVHQYAQLLTEWIKEQHGITIPFRSKNMEAVISHDIDIPYSYGKIRSVLSRAKALLKSQGAKTCAEHLSGYLKVRAGLEKDRFATFDYIMKTQAERGIRSTWFILLSDNLWGLDLSKYSKQLKNVAAAGHEIALHPGYDSYLSEDKRTAEKKAIEQLAGSTITGARNHFLRFKIPESYYMCHETGLRYDSTLGFAEHEGFRSGFCSPFKPFDPLQRKTIDVFEIPMSIMDGTFRDYLYVQPKEAEIRIKAMIDHVADIRGTIVFNWHNTFLLAEEAEWRSVYENSLDYMIEKNAVFSTVDELARKWSERWG